MEKWRLAFHHFEMLPDPQRERERCVPWTKHVLQSHFKLERYAPLIHLLGVEQNFKSLVFFLTTFNLIITLVNSLKT